MASVWCWPLLMCGMIDFLPHFGAPHFRYTGSDPALPVWNIGWPLALFVFDPRNGFHVGPIAVPVLGGQVGVLGTLWLVRNRSSRRRSSE